MSSNGFNQKEMCGCGRPLHYVDKGMERAMKAQVKYLGSTVSLPTTKGTWLVPRHYIVLHGITESSVATLAEQYGWQKIPDNLS